ncbi:MAG: hypothetical protein PHW64_03960 [Sulfuricurvum sp.]|nr:hypothetical protein [Sulfuricurvum sp.]
MNAIVVRLKRFRNFFRCFKKVSYGYVGNDECVVPSDKNGSIFIIGPDLYRIVIAPLNVASPSEALRYAPSYFDEGEEEYHYSAYRLDNERYLFCACNVTLLRECVKKFAIPHRAIRGFAYAQEAFEAITSPIALSPTKAWALSEGVVVQVASAYLAPNGSIPIRDVLEKLDRCLTPFSVALEERGILTQKTAMITAGLAAAVTVNILFQGFIAAQERERITQMMEEGAADQKLPATQMELDALSKSWEKKEAEQMKLRKRIAAFTNLKLDTHAVPSASAASADTQSGVVLIPGSNPSDRNLLVVNGDPKTSLGGEYLESLVYENGLVRFSIHAPNDERAEAIRDAVVTLFKIPGASIKDKTVIGSIE